VHRIYGHLVVTGDRDEFAGVYFHTPGVGVECWLDFGGLTRSLVTERKWRAVCRGCRLDDLSSVGFPIVLYLDRTVLPEDTRLVPWSQTTAVAGRQEVSFHFCPQKCLSGCQTHPCLYIVLVTLQKVKKKG